MAFVWDDILNLEPLSSVRTKLNALGNWVAGDGAKAINETFDATGTDLTSSNVQDVIVELNNKKVNAAVSVLSAHSTAVSQEPTTTDNPLQVEFGAAQYDATYPLSLASDGTITFHDDGRYDVYFDALFGRTGSTGTSILMFRCLLNGIQHYPSAAARVDSSDTLIPCFKHFHLDVVAGDVLRFQIVRDSSGDNSGGLFSQSPTSVAWDDAPNANLRIDQIG